jgi:hypothetical protein
VVDFFGRPLHSVGKILDDVFGIVTVHLVRMVDPRSGLPRIAKSDNWRPITIKAGDPVTFDPSTIRNQAIPNEHRCAWSPGHLLHGPVSIKPMTGAYFFRIALIIE